MLKRLQIKNYALIRDLDVQFNPGFTIITGETGAGKSILIGALSLILGQRADSSVLSDKENKCFVEATFDVSYLDLHQFFLESDLDEESQLLLRREITPNGKSRTFINDTPVNLKTLQEIGFHLIDIHSQHQNLELGTQQFQLKVLDLCAGNRVLLKEYQQHYALYLDLKHQLQDALVLAEQMKKDLDYYQFQFDQLKNANLQEGEQSMLETEYEMLIHSEEIKTTLLYVSHSLGGTEDNSLVRLKESVNLIGKISKFYPESEVLKQRLESVYLEMKDIVFEIEISAEKMEFDPGRIAFLKERLDMIYALQQKHHLGSVEELLQLCDSIENKIQTVYDSDQEVESLGIQIESEERILHQLAARLTMSRNEFVIPIEKKVTGQLIQLGMPHSQFKVEITTESSLTATGSDQVKFLFSANKNGLLNEISKVASGGEMSRLMLTIKALIAKSKELPTILFDEIDSGISGEIADKMGNIIKEMSEGMQVINITHLPQIAAKGDQHLLVYKEDEMHETITRLKYLDRQQRLEEIAKMLSGESITDAALLNASVLLG